MKKLIRKSKLRGLLIVCTLTMLLFTACNKSAMTGMKEHVDRDANEAYVETATVTLRRYAEPSAAAEFPASMGDLPALLLKRFFRSLFRRRIQTMSEPLQNARKYEYEKEKEIASRERPAFKAPILVVLTCRSFAQFGSSFHLHNFRLDICTILC